MTTPAMLELPEPELGYIETDKSRQPAFSARQMREALQSQPAAAVSDEEIWGLWDSQERTGLVGGPCPVKFARAILALRPQAESKTYADGTTATGPAPLPDVSPAEQDASLAESLLTDLEALLGQRNGASIKLRSLIRSLRPQAAIVGRTVGDGSGQAVIYDTTLPDSTPLYAGSNSQAVPMTRAQRLEAFRKAEDRMAHDINLCWRDALIEETEAHHGITQRADGGEKQA